MYRILDVTSEKDKAKLNRPCRKIINLQSPEITMLAQMMLQVCNRPGVAGVAANQLGKSYRMFALTMGRDEEPMVFYNPRIMSQSDETKTEGEGCLSVPGVSGFVEAPKWVVLRWQDKQGKHLEHTFVDFWARAVWHEMNHLNGVLFIDRCEKLYTHEEMQEMFAKSKVHAAQDILKQKMTPDELASLIEGENSLDETLKEVQP